MWERLGDLVLISNGGYLQPVLWSGGDGVTTPAKARYSIKMTPSAKREIDSFLAVEGPKGNHVNFASVIVAFLKERSHYDSNPNAVEGAILTLAHARKILGLNPIGYWKCRQCLEVHPVELGGGSSGFIAVCTQGGPYITVLPDEICATPELASEVAVL